METAQRLYIKKDPQVRRAIEALTEASELLRDPTGYVARAAARDEGGAQ